MQTCSTNPSLLDNVVNPTVLQHVNVTPESVEAMATMLEMWFTGNVSRPASFNEEDYWTQTRADEVYQFLFDSFFPYLNSDGYTGCGIGEDDSDCKTPWRMCSSFQIYLDIVLLQITQWLRTDGGNYVLVDWEHQTEALYEARFFGDPYVKILWQWFVFPIALQTMGICFFAWVVVATKRSGVPLWKSVYTGYVVPWNRL